MNNSPLNNLAQRYLIEGSEGSVLSAQNAENYVTWTGRIASFSAIVVNWDTHMDCAVQLRILQDIHKRDLALLHGQQVSGVQLHPCLYDKTREDADLAHSRLAKDFNLEENPKFHPTANGSPIVTERPLSQKHLSRWRTSSHREHLR